MPLLIYNAWPPSTDWFILIWCIRFMFWSSGHHWQVAPNKWNCPQFILSTYNLHLHLSTLIYLQSRKRIIIRLGDIVSHCRYLINKFDPEQIISNNNIGQTLCSARSFNWDLCNKYIGYQSWVRCEGLSHICQLDRTMTTSVEYEHTGIFAYVPSFFQYNFEICSVMWEMNSWIMASKG